MCKVNFLIITTKIHKRTTFVFFGQASFGKRPDCKGVGISVAVASGHTILTSCFFSQRHLRSLENPIFCKNTAQTHSPRMLALINRILDWFKSIFWKEEMELTLVGLQFSGKTTFVNVIAVSIFILFGCVCARIFASVLGRGAVTEGWSPSESRGDRVWLLYVSN